MTLLVAPGDPRGIGPEVTCRALQAGAADVVVVGSIEALRPWASGLTLVPVTAPVPRSEGVAVFDPGDAVEPVEVAALRWSVAACLARSAAALVTGPIHKARLAKRGFPHPGHTEFLGALCGVERPVMAFVGGRVRVALVTVHVPLRRVALVLTSDGVLHTIRSADHALRSDLGVRAPRIAVCGLNPHAGDDGLLGDEDQRVVAPGVAAALALGIDARGPVSAEAAFRSAVRGEVDLVVAMYHDQGLAPLKALEWALDPTERSVNWTLGLPILRVGVDHGTADDIAGKGVADAAGMASALSFARRLVRARATRSDPAA